ncbi:hypothetical protein E5676_scaffold121G00390 [Cucumis melo var. makuwa]|uniref:Uncharacterized protein n=1 Tax=Cucumis melo var. makuwa TaxID=1194695 RepID=A0A5D3BZ26_CUCMM|nr:hypothetical protein E5676_scaffold121G00390 [Cucumis melo var. makuwa]
MGDLMRFRGERRWTAARRRRVPDLTHSCPSKEATAGSACKPSPSAAPACTPSPEADSTRVTLRVPQPNRSQPPVVAWAQALQPRPWNLRRLGKRVVTVRTRRANLQDDAMCMYVMVRVLPWDTDDQIFVPTRAHVARVRERARDWVEVEVGAKASWRATRSDRGEP